MKKLSVYLIVLGLFVLAKFFGELFHIVIPIPILDWQAIFMFLAGCLAYNLIDKDI